MAIQNKWNRKGSATESIWKNQVGISPFERGGSDSWRGMFRNSLLFSPLQKNIKQNIILVIYNFTNKKFPIN
jgi:hypothetical protein